MCRGTHGEVWKITFSVTGLTGENPGQWAFNQSTVVHELAHVWDKRLNPTRPPLSSGMGRALSRAFNRDEGGRPSSVRSTGEEDFAESVAASVMSGTRTGPALGFYGSVRARYIACVAAANNRAEGRCG